jgi:hypothetical protein
MACASTRREREPVAHPRGRRSTQSGGGCRTGETERRRAQPVRQELATRRPVRWPTSSRRGKRSGGDRSTMVIKTTLFYGFFRVFPRKKPSF